MVLRSLALPLLLCLVLCGCGSAKNPVAGQVIRNGQPVDIGVVRFTPDVHKGFDGPTVTLKIQEGQFSSAKEGLSMVPGEHSVAVYVAPAVVGREMPTEEHRYTINVPEGGTNDLVFDVTKKHRKKGKGAPRDPELDE
ncbi:MAG TPA: hypothetical protein VH682_20445 [Gemmataceae bacterium]|jgi:hypothetical protein